MIFEIKYTCKDCGSKENSVWEIGNDNPKDWMFSCYCSECQAEFKATTENSVIELVGK